MVKENVKGSEMGHIWEGSSKETVEWAENWIWAESDGEDSDIASEVKFLC